MRAYLPMLGFVLLADFVGVLQVPGLRGPDAPRLLVR